MHILIITPGFPKDEKDTSCIPPMQEFLKELRISHPEFIISVVALHYPYKRLSFKWNGISVYSCGGKGRKIPLKIFIWILSILVSLKINRKLRIDIIHSFWLTDTALIGSILSKLLKVKHISTMMGQDAKESNKYLRRLNLKNTIKVAVSDFQAGIFKQSCKMEADKIILWGIKPFSFGNIPRQIDILGAGSLIPVKNFRLFIKIINVLKKQFPDINSILIGDGEQINEHKELVHNNNLESNIKFAGFQSRENVLSFMNKSKILLHTSSYESFGYVIAEALASGCYVVCKPVGCAKKNERLFTAQDEDEFINIIRRILLYGKEFIPCNLFPVEQTAKSYAELYLSISKGN